MKKSILKVAGTLTLAASVLLASCSNATGAFSSQIDTVLYLSAPEVSAVAYPGMNYVSWTPVANANGYVVYVYEDGKYVRSTTCAYNALKYTDTALKPKSNGTSTTYTYYVEAISKTSTGRAVITENTRSSGVSVTAIMPSYNVKSLELNNHEHGINAKGDEAYVLNASNIHVALDGFNKFSVEFPSKAYLKYTPVFYIDNAYETRGKEALSTQTQIYDEASNDKILKSSATSNVITESGVYHFGVKADAANGHYGSSDIVFANETITIKTLAGTISDITSAAYVNASKIRVVFPKFTLDDGTTAPESYYKVYRSVKDAERNYTAVSGKVAFTDSSKTALFVEDAITDNTVDYVYTLVVTDGTKFASSSKTKEVGHYTLTAQTATTVAGSATCEDKDNLLDDITWTITLPSTDVKITGIYTYAPKAADVFTVVAGDFDKTNNLLAKATPTTTTAGKVYKVFTEDHEVGKKVYMLVTTTQDGKADGEWISEGVETKYASFNAATISAAKYDNRLDNSNVATITPVLNDVIVEVKDSFTAEDDDASNYEYKLFWTTSTIATDISSSTITFSANKDWNAGESITLSRNNAYDTTATTYAYVADKEFENLADGIYAFKVVKTHKVTKEEKVSAISYVTIDTSDSIAYKPTISVNWKDANTDKVKTATIEFTKNNTTNSPIYLKDKNGNTTSGFDHISSYVEEAAEDPKVTYTLYRAAILKGKTDVVYARVAEVTHTTAISSTSTYTTYKWTDSEMTSTTVNSTQYTYTDKIVYSYDDEQLDTAESYSYIVVCTKANSAPYITNVATVYGAN